jgi:hypothetical protein
MGMGRGIAPTGSVPEGLGDRLGEAVLLPGIGDVGFKVDLAAARAMMAASSGRGLH